MTSGRIVIVGGGAAGFFAALACADAGSAGEIVILEKTAQFLSKVKISGGGRCNVTHACFNEREFATRFPRGERALIAPFKQFQASDTVAWFAARGVKLKTESDGRMFPVTDSSQTIIDCLLNAARAKRSEIENELRRGTRCKKFRRRFRTDVVQRRNVVAAINCCWRRAVAGRLRSGNWRFRSATRWKRRCRRCSRFTLRRRGCESWRAFRWRTAEVSVAGTKLRERGPLLVTHWGLSGPVILRLSAWGARVLHEMDYQCPLRVNWLPHLNDAQLAKEFETRRGSQAARLVVNSPMAPLPARSVGATGARGGHSARNALVGSLAPGATQAHSAIVARRISGERQKPEQG